MSRSASKTLHSNSSPTYVRPVAVSEKSTLESVADFFADVVPHTATSYDDKEQIIWVRFEQLSQPSPERLEDKKDITLIVLGYANGAQIWQMHPSGDAQELLSMRQGPVKVYSILQRTSEFDSSPPTSQYLVASADESKHSSSPFSNLKLTLLSSGEKVWNHSFKNTINDVHHNSKLLLVTFHQKIAAFDLTSLKPTFTLSGCFPGTDQNLNPVALGTSWLAFADSKIVTHVKSQCEGNTETVLSYTASVLSTAKNVAQGVTTLGESLMSTFAAPYLPRKDSSAALGVTGVVTVVDCDNLTGEGTPDHFELTDNYLGNAVICHFEALPAHSRVAYLKFDYSGTLLFCACTEGQSFHIYRLLADVCGSKQAGVQHLYTLHRGDTTARVLDVTYSLDSRWLAVCTARGTAHVFPINPYGGKCTARTHTNQYVVNKSTKYQKSAGLDEFTPSPAGASSSSSLIDSLHPAHIKFNSGALENPRIKSYADTIVTPSLVRIKQPILSIQGNMHKFIPSKKMAALFIPTHGRTRKLSHGLRSPQARESLYILGNMGNLMEYILEPYCECDLDKINDMTELKLSTTARSRWNLNRTFTHKDRNKLSPSQLLLGSSPGSDTANTRYGSKESISSDPGLSKSNEFDQPWLSQVEIVTYSGPNRRLWMGPQFKFKTYNSNTIAVSSQSPALFPSNSPEVQATSDIICDTTDLESLQINNYPTPPITMPLSNKHRQASGESLKQRAGSLIDEIFIEAGSFEPSPHLATTEMSFDAFEDAVQYPSSDAMTFNLLADAMQDQKNSSESLNSRDLMMFPPGS